MDSPSPSKSPSQAAFIIQISALVIAVVALFRISLWSIWQRTNPFDGDPNWGHAVFIPFVALAYIYVHADQIRRERTSRSIAGIVLIVFCLPLLSFALWMRPASWQMGEFFQGISLVLMIFGIVLALAGPAIVKLAAFPILYLMLAIPWPSGMQEAITFPLQRFAATASVAVLQCTGLNAEQSGNQIEIYAATGQPRLLNVAEACSGIRSLITFLAIGAAIGFLPTRPLWRKIFIMLMAVPVAILCNVIRIAGQGLLDYYVSQRLSEGFYHEFVGIVMLIPGMLMLMALGKLLDAIFGKGSERTSLSPGKVKSNAAAGISAGSPSKPAALKKGSKSPVRATPAALAPLGRSFHYWTILSLVTVSAIIVNFAPATMIAPFNKQPVPLRQPVAALPARLGPWQQVSIDTPLDKDTEAVLAATSYVIRDYVDTRLVGPDVLRAFDGKPALQRQAMARELAREAPAACIQCGLYYYTGKLDQVGHVPEVCYVMHGYVSVGDGDLSTWTIAHQPLQLKTVQFDFPRDPLPPERSTVSYFFQVNGEYDGDSGAVRHRLLNVLEPRAYFAKFEMMTTFTDEEKSRDVMSDFLTYAMPELENILPGPRQFKKVDLPATKPDDAAGAPGVNSPGAIAPGTTALPSIP